MILTGGFYTKTSVSEYSQNGWVRDLASLNVGRYGHGCSSFVSAAERVSVEELYESTGAKEQKHIGQKFNVLTKLQTVLTNSPELTR